ncbi:hypothetical protein [Thermococcus sp.]|uniref:hypothetical protein n=1 Tax=Thermococcus sp. TaxID=35749 RepID=UPI00263884EA|nr:hypothetical protein [Thermococcus sp.]
MEKKDYYRALLAIVLVLAVVYTLGILGIVPFRWSYYITIFMIILFFALKLYDRFSRAS